MILVDSSVWIDYLRGEGSAAVIELRRLLTIDHRAVAICEPIAMELLAGAPPTRLTSIERLVDGLVDLPVDPAVDYRSAAALYRLVRTSGHTVRALNDCLIAVIAARHEATLLHKDVDFDRIAALTGQAVDSRR